MSVKTIAVFLDATPAGAARLAYAAALAEAQQARLVGLLVLPAFETDDPAEAMAIGRAAIDGLIRRQDTREQAAADEARQALEAQCAKLGVPHECRVLRESVSLAEVRHHVLHADLVVVGAGRLNGLPAGGAADVFLMSTGIPVLRVPDGWRAEAPRRVLLGWNASAAARRAVTDGLPLLRAAELVTVLVVDAEKRDYHGEEPGADLATFLGRHGVTADVLRLGTDGAKVAEVIADAAVALRADLIALGAYGRGRMTEVMFGGVTRSLIRSCPVPLLIAH